MKTAAWIDGIARYLLNERASATNSGGVAEERERYQRIADAALEMRRALSLLASPGVLLAPLGQLRKSVDSNEAGLVGGPYNVDTAYALCWPWGERAHPLFFVEQAAKKAAADLAPHVRGPISLHTRRRGNPASALALACARLLHDLMREPPAISEGGRLVEVMKRVWTYATGEDAPIGLGHHARNGARQLRRILADD